jgi:hypothetical protein
MNSLEKTRVILLAHSTNMLNAARNGDWDRFAALESEWQSKLEAAQFEFGDQLRSISEQLLQHNQQIQHLIKQAQAYLVAEMQKNAQARSALKKYLK